MKDDKNLPTKSSTFKETSKDSVFGLLGKSLKFKHQKTFPLKDERQINISDEKDISDMKESTKRRSLIDPYKCSSASLHRKWILTRNVILICIRMKKILHEVLLYGTSDKLLDINRGINKVRDVMIPDAGKESY